VRPTKRDLDASLSSGFEDLTAGSTICQAISLSLGCH
jgi:hypothetical protein